MDSSLKRLIFAFLLINVSIVGGTLGFYFIEGLSIVDAFYQAVITLSTVGFMEVQSLSQSGRIFTTFYILFNLGVIAYAVSMVTSFIFEGKLKIIYKNYMSDRRINKLNNHVIVCGYGRNGKEACEELERSGRPFVVIEKEESVLDDFDMKDECLILIGNAITESTLKDAGLEKAAVIIITTPSDADNVFIALTARELNPGIKIISRASEKESESKLYRAGANNVIMPDRLGGMFMAQMETKPVVIEFLNLMTGFSGQHYHLEQIRYEDLKPMHHKKTIGELEIHETTGGTVIGVKDNLKVLFQAQVATPR